MRRSAGVKEASNTYSRGVRQRFENGCGQWVILPDDWGQCYRSLQDLHNVT